MTEAKQQTLPPPQWWEEVSKTKAACAGLDARVQSLEEYEDKQNGSLQRMEQKIEELRGDVSDRLNRLQWWLIGLLGSAVVSLILLIVNMIHG
jgi:tetrahydromethanopterin S-methyltransferase subunit G